MGIELCVVGLVFIVECYDFVMKYVVFRGDVWWDFYGLCEVRVDELISGLVFVIVLGIVRLY